MSREKVFRYCLVCRKGMRRSKRIEMGYSVTWGKMAVCSKKCQDIYNCPAQAKGAQEEK